MRRRASLLAAATFTASLTSYHKCRLLKALDNGLDSPLSKFGDSLPPLALGLKGRACGAVAATIAITIPAADILPQNFGTGFRRPPLPSASASSCLCRKWWLVVVSCPNPTPPPQPLIAAPTASRDSHDLESRLATPPIPSASVSQRCDRWR
jgi:hypothetical protein